MVETGFSSHAGDVIYSLGHLLAPRLTKLLFRLIVSNYSKVSETVIRLQAITLYMVMECHNRCTSNLCM
jgi:hypothetical protein